MAREQGYKRIFLPADNALEASAVPGLEIYPVRSLSEILNHFVGDRIIEPQTPLDLEKFFEADEDYDFDFRDIVGQELAKEALILAAAGGHNVLMTGPAGSGKTLLARTLPSILPRLTVDEALEVTKIYSIIGGLQSGESLIRRRPFRSPHHTVSRIGLIGGGSNPIPGEISLAHRGVLFLDEFPEYPRHVLEALRQPIEDGMVSISRARMSVTYPANFMFVTAQNPCPCGNYDVPGKECKCTNSEVQRYKKKISGPILDRIDIHIDVPAVEVEKLTDQQNRRKVESSSEIRSRVQVARNKQQERFEGTSIYSNADMSARDIKKYVPLDKKSQEILRFAVTKYGLSARSYHKLVKLARTFADLRGADEVNEEHISQTLHFKYSTGER
jgi:magnesium chelatase family protein